MNQKQFEDTFLSLIDRVFKLKEEKLANPMVPAELVQKADIKLQEAPSNNVKELLENLIENSVNTQNPRFLNQLFGGSQPISWLGEFVVAALNTSMATYEIAPVGTLCELEIINEINKDLGFKSYKGLMVPGGSYANMMGLHCARQWKSPEAKEKGNFSQKEPWSVFISEEAHYSFSKAMVLMGMGTANLIKVKVTKDHKICIEDLEKKIKASKSPLCVVSTAGTTVWGAYDPIDKIQDLADKYKLWHHVDAAWGGPALWYKGKDTLMPEVKRVDSITLDFHKLMGSTLTKGMFITSKPEILHEANSGGGGSKYIFHADKEVPSVDTGVYAIQCGRKVDSIPLWLQWKFQGTSGYREKIEEFFALKKWLVGFLKENKDKYELLHEPEFMNFCFKVKNLGLSGDSEKELNLNLRQKLMARGNFMVNYSSSKEHGTFFRLVLNHWGVDKEILKELFKEIDIIAENTLS